MDDRFQLRRFIDAQEAVYDRVLAELGRGRKSSHWMWFIFPQLRGLGRSAMAERFAIASLDEARAYLDHAVLGVRLRECTELVTRIGDRTVVEIFGYPDDLKFCSSMTLFAHAAVERDIFQAALHKFFGGREDAATLNLLHRRDAASSQDP